jgi:catechol 2,3-dioxygenase-like lactoylglutathione lyase family enzyme
MEQPIRGVHHITAIAGDPQRNIDFYTGLLGLRLVKLTVNFDDPETYHLYYGDAQGRPGTILTFFPWPGAPRGQRGSGQATVIAFSIPVGALPFWTDRLVSGNVALDGSGERFGNRLIGFRDPDGLRLELVEARDDRQPRTGGGVPAEYAVRGFHSVLLSEEGYERTAAVLDLLGFRKLQEAGNRFRYQAGEGGPGALVDVECVPDLPPGRVAVGCVHHIAWRAADDREHQAWRQEIAHAGLNVTPIIDRKYFRSIYFREPGGVLFEVATDAPGFAVDEPVERLGSGLVLPPWLEPMRKSLESRLPPVRLPERAWGA